MIRVQGRELWVMVVSASPYEHMIGKPNVKYVANMHGELMNLITLHMLYRQEPVDQIYKKSPNPKCRLYWCLIEFIDRRYSQSCWYIQSVMLVFSTGCVKRCPSNLLLWLALPPPPCTHVYSV